MSPSKRRKLSQDNSEPPRSNGQTETSVAETTSKSPQQSSRPDSPAAINKSAGNDDATETASSASVLSDRQARFAALKSRAQKSAQTNIKEVAAESARMASDPNAMTALQRKQAIATHNLLKADTEAAGEDFERKRAWDWTIEESEKWDRRMEKKARHRDNVAFQDHTQEANKVYKRQLRDMKPDMEAYEKQKAEMVERMAANGGLEIVETEDGEVVAIDKNNSFYADKNTIDFMDNKPEKEAVDRLVQDLRKAEETRLRKRRARGMQDDDGEDVTFINEKNKQFNQKLARFYNKYTTEIRESFERGTMI